MATKLELDRAKVVNEQFVRCVKNHDFPKANSATSAKKTQLSDPVLTELFTSQMESRLLDLKARELKHLNQGFYTIASSGHEGNAGVAQALRADDPALLHYRSGAFFMQRSKKALVDDPIMDQLYSLVAAKACPASGGRHKVFGSEKMNVLAQTSTIASHLPKAVGLAYALSIAKKNQIPPSDLRFAMDSVVLVSFGDGSINHASAQVALNTLGWAKAHQIRMPMVLLCEDNGLSISYPTPKNWVESTMSQRVGIEYLKCDGTNVFDVYVQAQKACVMARKRGQPVFLHMTCKRLMGHAGSDIEFHYLNQEMIEAQERQDPLLHSARSMIEQGLMSDEDILQLYERIRLSVEQKAQAAIKAPKLTTVEDIKASIIPPPATRRTPKLADESIRRALFGAEYEKLAQPRTLKQNLNAALIDLMAQYPQLILFGEDVGTKGGVYRVTQDIQALFSRKRIFDTMIDEQTILASAIGMGHLGLLPMPEIQFLAYVHNAVDQIRGEAATCSFFSGGKYTNPMIIRIPSFAYQKGFGGHFHNENAIAFLREIPGVIIACPSRADYGPKLLRECTRLAFEEQRVVAFLEPIALYMTKDLCQDGDRGALAPYPAPKARIEYGQISLEGKAGDLIMITYGNGAHLSRQVQARLSEQGYAIQILDLHWLHPLPIEAIANAIQDQKVLIVDECRRTGSLSEELFTSLYEHSGILSQRITSEDCFIPTGEALKHVLISYERLEQKVLSMLSSPQTSQQGES